MVNVGIVSDTRYPVNRKIIRKAVGDALDKNKVQVGEVEVSVAVVGKRKMKELALKYLGDSENHEVLAFPLEEITQQTKGFINTPDETLHLGDIVLCWPEVLMCAGRDEIMVDDEVYFLCAHALEHLLGKHHDG